jgi:hypothetical protein
LDALSLPDALPISARGATSAPATITVTVSGPVIWFVDPAVAGPGTGTLTDPFKTLSSANAVATATGSRIFVSSGTVSGGHSQPTNGWLVGQGVTGASFDAVFGITPPAGTVARPSVNGTRPTVQGSVALADGSVVRGLNVSSGAATGLVGSGDDGVTVAEVGVSSSGAPHGISLDDTNTTSGTVTVDGGTISGSTGAGVLVDGSKNVSLANMTITGSAAEGVSAATSTGVSLTDTTVANSGTHGVALVNGSGAASLTRVVAHGSEGDNARVFGSTGTTTVSVTDSTFRDNDAASGGNGLLVQADGAASVTLTASGNSYLRNNQVGLAVRAFSSQKMTATVTNGTWVVDGGAGVELLSNATGGLAYSVSGGSVTGCATCGAPVNVYKGTGGTGTGANAMSGTISGLTVDNGGSGNAPGIWVHAEGAGASRHAVTGNTVTNVAHNGILVAAGNGSNALDATVTGNTVTLGTGALQGIAVDAGLLTGDTASVCADVKTNTVVSPTSDVRVRNRQAGTTFRLPGYAGAATDTTAVAAFLTAQNTITDAAATVGSSPGFTGGAACAAP